MITIDASVLVAAGSPEDPAHEVATAFLEVVGDRGLVCHQPTLSVVEVAAAIGRRTGREDLAADASAALLAMPGLVLHPLDVEASAEAASLAARLRLRAADAVYAAIAVRHDAALVTLDDEILVRSVVIVDAVSPAGWLDRQPERR